MIPTKNTVADQRDFDSPTSEVSLDPYKAWFVLLAISTIFVLSDIVLQTLNQTLTPAFGGWETVLLIMDADREASIPTWWGTMLLVAAAAVSALAAVDSRHRDSATMRRFAAIALLFALVSMDEQAMIHEHSIAILRNRFDTSGIFFFAWVIPGLIAVAILTIVFGRFVYRLGQPVRELIVAAAAIYLAGALGLEMVGGWWAEREGQLNLTYMTITSVEEWLECIGAASYCFAIMLLLRGWNSRVVLSVTGRR